MQPPLALTLKWKRARVAEQVPAQELVAQEREALLVAVGVQEAQHHLNVREL